MNEVDSWSLQWRHDVSWTNGPELSQDQKDIRGADKAVVVDVGHSTIHRTAEQRQQLKHVIDPNQAVTIQVSHLLQAGNLWPPPRHRGWERVEFGWLFLSRW